MSHPRHNGADTCTTLTEALTITSSSKGEAATPVNWPRFHLDSKTMYRIGNFVRQPNREGRISDVWQDAIRIEGYYNGYDYNLTTPIKLTEEWLERLGFKMEVIEDGTGYYYNLKLSGDKYCDLSLISLNKNGVIKVALHPYETMFAYKYVHELQNVFYAVTGAELECVDS